jgi:carboxyl-terminal processing protease
MKGLQDYPGAPRLRYLFALTLVSGLAGGVAFDRHVLSHFIPTGNVPSNAISDFRLMAEAWNTIHEFFVGRAALRPRVLTYGAISGMVRALGDVGHSTFLSPQMVKQVRNFERGEFNGIGAEVQMKDGHVVIVAPIDGSPAQKAGLRPGDIILKVDGQDITGMALDQVVKQILGRPGTSVTLAILSSRGGITRDVTLVRAPIKVNHVTWQRLPGTTMAHLRIASFNQGITELVRKALTEIKTAGLSGIIFDLRNNPGGLLDEAIGTASQFLHQGNVLLQKNAKGEIKPTPVQPGAIAPNIPMAVLINSGSASAAEIVAGALQDARRATLVGERTFGAGTVLSEFQLSDGSALLLAIQEWLTPGGHTIWHKGITPKIEVHLSPEVAPLIPPAERTMTEAELKASKDEQLLRALEVLTARPGEVVLR